MTLCAYCNLKSDSLVRDHVVPRSRGGPDNATNIVMACVSCNASKSDSLASEWLGDRCPESVLEIENAVHRKLKARFAKRDKKNKPFEPTLFAFHINQKSGFVDYVGDVIEERGDALRVEVIDAFLSVGAGIWSPSGELIDLPKSECRIFNDRVACYSAVNRINSCIRV